MHLCVWLLSLVIIQITQVTLSCTYLRIVESNTMAELLEPVVLGDGIQLRNRICMGTMTRNRCTNGNKPTQVNVKHYADRARDGTGLIVAEGTFIYPSGVEWPNAPVMYNDSHAEAWTKVTSEVHKVGGKILFQPWHPGEHCPFMFSVL